MESQLVINEIKFVEIHSENYLYFVNMHLKFQKKKITHQDNIQIWKTNKKMRPSES